MSSYLDNDFVFLFRVSFRCLVISLHAWLGFVWEVF